MKNFLALTKVSKIVDKTGIILAVLVTLIGCADESQPDNSMFFDRNVTNLITNNQKLEINPEKLADIGSFIGFATSCSEITEDYDVISQQHSNEKVERYVEELRINGEQSKQNIDKYQSGIIASNVYIDTLPDNEKKQFCERFTNLIRSSQNQFVAEYVKQVM